VIGKRAGALARRTARSAVRAARSFGGDKVRLRRLSFWLAVVVLAWSLVFSAVNEPWSAGPGFALAAPFVAVLVLLAPQRRHLVFGLGSGVLALAVPDANYLAPGAAALVFLAIVDSTAIVAWLSLAAAFAGAVLGLLTYPELPTPAAFIAIALGAAVGQLMRSSGRTELLEQETQALRTRTRATEEQARWLEQRTSLARELHDVVGHHVTAMVVQAEAGQVGDPQSALREIGTLGRTALGELDALVVHLRDPDAELAVSAPPRLSDIDELLAAPLRHQGVAVTVRVDPDPGLDEIGVLTVYRIAQEALTNVARHAQAGAASVEVRRLGEHVRLRITDDGIGPPEAPERGSGLLGIQERVSARGGVWELGERLGGGTIVDVLLPVPPSGATS
jgi:signal transduction histidine kinase